MGEKVVRLRERNGIIFAHSLDFANDFANKRHDNVLQKLNEIRAKMPLILRTSWYREAVYYDRYGHKQPCVEMTRSGFSFLVNRFTGAEAFDWQIAYQLKWDEMETRLRGLNLDPRTDALFDRTKPDNVVAFPSDPQGELALETPSEAELPIIDPVREEAELEAELQRYSAEFGYETPLPEGLVAIDWKQREAFLKAWRGANPGRNQLLDDDDAPPMCMGPGGILTEKYDV